MPQHTAEMVAIVFGVIAAVALCVAIQWPKSSKVVAWILGISMFLCGILGIASPFLPSARSYSASSPLISTACLVSIFGMSLAKLQRERGQRT